MLTVFYAPRYKISRYLACFGFSYKIQLSHFDPLWYKIPLVLSSMRYHATMLGMLFVKLPSKVNNTTDLVIGSLNKILHLFIINLGVLLERR